MVKACVFAVLLIACGLEVPDVGEFNQQCRPAAGGPNCNGDRRRDECAAAGLPTAYGFDTGCLHPVRPSDAGACAQRRQGLYRCHEAGDLTCCFE